MTIRSFRRLTCLAVLVGAVASAPGLAARTIVECIDEAGQKSFREFCPPGSVKKGEKRLQGKIAPSVDVSLVAAKNPVTIYTIPKCEACDLMRMQLQQRGVPFKEKDASTDVAIQDELKALIGAKDNLVKVPVMTVGKDVLAEYKPADVNAKLDAAGYPGGKESAKPSPAAEAQGQAETGTASPATAGEGATNESAGAPPSAASESGTKAQSLVTQ